MRLAAQQIEQKSGVKKVKLPEKKASDAMRQVLRSLQVGLTAVRNRMSLSGMVFAAYGSGFDVQCDGVKPYVVMNDTKKVRALSCFSLRIGRREYGQSKITHEREIAL